MAYNYYDTPLWDSSLSDDERLDYLLQQLTLKEKFACLGTGCPKIERLRIPAFSVGGEAAHGVQARNDQKYDKGMPAFTTSLPDPIGMSATWDEELIKEAGAMVGREARGLYHSGKHKSLSLWAPTVDMERDPRWGRTEEGYGEDPFLTGKMAGAYVDGLQGDDEDFLCCAATLKHFYANNNEAGRTYLSNSVNLRNRYEYYLSPFRHIIQEHHVEGILPLSLEKLGKGEEGLAVIGPLSDVWYKGWYSGIPPYRVTPADGIYEAFAEDKKILKGNNQSFPKEKNIFIKGVSQNFKEGTLIFENGIQL